MPSDTFQKKTSDIEKKKKKLAPILLKLRKQWQLNSKLYVTITQ